MNALSSRRRWSAAAWVAALLAAQPLMAADCGLCDKEIVTSPDLAACFLGRYEELSKGDGGAVIVDLSDCEESRGIVEALPAPRVGEEEPDVKFMILPEQLACLKAKLEDPALVLDPTATINLESCG